MPRHARRRLLPRRAFVGVVVIVAIGGPLLWSQRSSATPPGRSAATIAARLQQPSSLPRDTQAYAGLGTWVDGFDFGPAYQAAGAAPAVTPASLDDMAKAGVTTLYLQAARADSRSPGGVVDRALVGEFLIRAHQLGMRVVGWYLPTFADLDTDVANLRKIVDFDALGHRFDGVAVDIEATKDVPDVAERNQRLIELSGRLRAASGTDTLGAIVLPPVLTEVVNTDYWPDFPWTELRPLYDVWLPMSYWTFRSSSSGYHDGYTYNDESTRRLRNDLGDQRALVHAIGGIGDTVTAAELEQFAQSLVDDDAIGGSIYDWASMTAEARSTLTTLFATGPAAHLPPPP